MISHRVTFRAACLVPALCLLWISGCSPREEGKQEPPPPAAREQLQEISLHGKTWTDAYAWMQATAPDDPDFRSYLNAEQAYTSLVLSGTEALQRQLMDEINSRLVVQHESDAIRVGSYSYWREIKEGSQYPVYYREKAGGPPQLLLDLNDPFLNDPLLHKSGEFIRLGSFSVSPDEKLIAYTLDLRGDQRYGLYVMSLDDRSIITSVAETGPSIAFGKASSEVFFTSFATSAATSSTASTASSAINSPPGTKTGAATVLWKQDLGSLEKSEIYSEQADGFDLSVYNARNGNVLLDISSPQMNEIRLVAENGASVPILARFQNRFYKVRFAGEQLFLLSNNDAAIRSMQASTAGKLDDLQVVMSACQDCVVEDYEVFTSHIVLLEREAMTYRIRVLDRQTARCRRCGVRKTMICPTRNLRSKSLSATDRCLTVRRSTPTPSNA